MSTMFYSASQIDPATGLPKKKNPKAPTFTAQQLQNAFNPNSTFGPAPQVDYGFGRQGVPTLPGMPDYHGLLESHLAPLRLELQAQGIADQSQADAAAGRGFTLYGQVPDFTGIQGLDLNAVNRAVTPQVRQMAQQNTEAGLSVVARQNKAFADQVRAIKNSLAARGALRSGEAGYQLQQAQLQRDQGDFDSRLEFADFLAGLHAGLAERQRQDQLRLAQAATDAEPVVRQMYPGEAPPPGGYATAGLPAAPPVGHNAGAAGDELLSPWRNDFVDDRVKRQQQQIAQVLRRHIAV